MTWQNDVQMAVCVCVVGHVIWRDTMMYRWQCVCVLLVMSYDMTEWRTDGSMCVCCWSCHMTWQNDVQMAVCVCIVCRVIWHDRMTYRWQYVCVLLIMSYDVSEWRTDGCVSATVSWWRIYSSHWSAAAATVVFVLRWYAPFVIS